MSIHDHTYIGAFLKLTNIFKDVTKIHKWCPQHGERTGEYCSICGSKNIEKEIIRSVCKDIVGHEYEWEDEMMQAYDFNDGSCVLLLPNHRNTGEIEFSTSKSIVVWEDTFKSDSLTKLTNRYGKYINWLKNNRNINVEVIFGCVHYHV